MVGGNRMRDILHHHRFAGTRRGNDQRALAFTLRRDQVDHAAGHVIFLIQIHELHFQAFFGVQRGEIIKIHAVAQVGDIFKIHQFYFHHREIALVVFRGADDTLHRIASAKAQALHNRRSHINIIRASEVIRFRRAQESEPILQHFDHARAGDFFARFSAALQNGKHHFLLKQ